MKGPLEPRKVESLGQLKKKLTKDATITENGLFLSFFVKEFEVFNWTLIFQIAPCLKKD